MSKEKNNWLPSWKKEILENKLVYILLITILFLGFFVRVYRIDQLLGFYFDQGRDALVIWDLWHNHKLFLIGPTTGIEGIYRGPWYYWLIAPFYLIGRGNPVWPSVFLSFTTILAGFFAFVLGKKIVNYKAGLLAAFIFSFSFNLVQASRWLSNPTPMLLISMLLLFSLYQILDGKKLWWISVGFLLGLAMQFGSAAEVFYFLATFIFAIWQKKNLPSFKVLLISIGGLFLVFLPQIYFDFKHDHVLYNAIHKFLVEEKSFKGSFLDMVQIRFPFYFDVFYSKLFVVNPVWRNYAFWGTILAILVACKGILKNKYLLTTALFLVSPMLGMLFFQGNYGNVYDYYFTGYYLIFVIFFSVTLFSIPQKFFRNMAVLIFLLAFAADNYTVLTNYIKSGVSGSDTVTFGNQMQAVDWVFDNNASNLEFNQDAYVPPVIPYTYDYLFLWQATMRCGSNLCNLKLDSQTPLLYTLYEVDPPHPERLEAWLARQKGIGEVKETKVFGGITVERRSRVLNNKK